MLATNVGLGRWGTAFADDRLAAETAGRIVHHGRLAGFGGPSHRPGGRPCWASREASGAPVTEPEEVACPNPKTICDHFRKRSLTKHNRDREAEVRRGERMGSRCNLDVTRLGKR